MSMPVQVEGMSDPLDKALVDGLGGMEFSERRLRAETGYSASVPCAREVRAACIKREGLRVRVRIGSC